MKHRSPPSLIAGLVLAASAFLATACPDANGPAALKDCTVSFEVDGGSAVASVVVKEGSAVAEPAAPTKAGHAFVGWYADAARADAWDFAADLVAADMTLYARWAAVHSIAYVLNSGVNASANPASYVAGQAVALATPTRSCRVFDGWYESSDFSGDPVASIGASASGDKTLYAKWAWADYALKDTGPAGGFICFKRLPAAAGDPSAADSWMYLEAGASDLDSGKWSNVNVSASCTTSTACGPATIGYGKANTDKIVNQAGHTDGAAKSCADYAVTVGGVVYDDWFLPSVEECYHAYTNLKAGSDPVGGFGDAYYWSSTENSGNTASQALAYNFTSGGSGSEFKANTARVRPVRQF